MKNINVEDAILACSTTEPLDNRVLVVCDKIRRVRQKEYSMLPRPGTEKKGKDGTVTAVMTKVKPMVDAKYQVATVVQVPAGEQVIKVGDRVSYVLGSCNDYDLIPGVSVLLRYNIATRVK